MPSAAVLLPGRFPDLRDMATWIRSDVVFLDDTLPNSRKSRVHRGRIRTAQGLEWVHLDAKLMKTLRYAYANSAYFEFYEPEIEARIFGPTDEWLRWLFGVFEIPYAPCRVSESGFPIPDHFHPIYHEPASKNYQPIKPWMREVEFTHPEYEHHLGGFVPGACCLDLLFECGPESVRILDTLRP